MSEKQQEKQKNKDTYMDPKLMERIGWSEEDIGSYISSYSNFEEEEEQQQQQKKPRNPYKNRVQKVEVPAATTKMEVKKEKAAEKKEDAAVVIEDV